MDKIVTVDTKTQLTPEETNYTGQAALRQPDGLSEEDYYTSLKSLLQLGVDDQALAPWVRTLPENYEEVLDVEQKLDLWRRTTDVAVDDAKERAGWGYIVELVETLVGTQVHNKLYLWHLVKKRSSGMSSMRYYSNISKSTCSEAEVDKNGLISYQVKERRGTMVEGFEEVFRLLSSDELKLLPASLLTRDVSELSKKELVTELQRLSSLSDLPHQQPLIHRLIGLYVNVWSVKSRPYAKMEWTPHEDKPSAMTGLLLYVCLLLLRTMSGKSMLTSLEDFVSSHSLALRKKPTSDQLDRMLSELLTKSKSVTGVNNTKFLRVALGDPEVMKHVDEMISSFRFANLRKVACACGLPPLCPK